MAEDKNILARWSRLKRENAKEETKARTRGTARDPSSAPHVPPKAAEVEDPEPFDLSQLPPLESIVAGSDIRAFLQRGVPLELTRAALRKAWSSDPTIRSFVEMAENQWDFATGSGIPGFGSLTAADDIPQLVAKALGDWRDLQQGAADGGPGDRLSGDSPQFRAADAASEPIPHCEAPIGPERSSAGDPKPDCAPQQHCDEEHQPAVQRRARRHGGALPS